MFYYINIKFYDYTLCIKLCNREFNNIYIYIYIYIYISYIYKYIHS